MTNPPNYNPGLFSPFPANLAALTTAVQADEAVMLTALAGDTQVVQGAPLRLAKLGALGALTLTITGAATGSFTYVVVPKLGYAPGTSATANTSTGPAALSGSTPIKISWPALANATSYDVYRSVGGSTQGFIGNTTLTYFTDVGLAGDTTTAPTVDLTGRLHTGSASDLYVVALITPPLVTVTNGGTAGSTSYTYVVSAVGPWGEAPASGVATSTGNATLSSSNTNIISWNFVPGAESYRVYRSASSGTPSGTGFIGSVVNVGGQATFSLVDTGITGTLNVPTANTTGGIKTPGPAMHQTVYTGGGNTGAGGKVVVSSATGVTLTAAQFLADILVRTSGSGGISDATPSAAALVAQAGPGIVAGAMHRLEFRNEGSGTQTITAGSGVTLRAGNTNTILTVASRVFTIVFTTVTPGSEAVEIISGSTSAY